MNWLANYLPASFRGVPFKVASTEDGSGRRTVVHEYALRDKPFVEDMGLKTREFTVEAYLIGTAYQAQRDALLAACEAFGPGQLVHPYKGTLTVSCSDIKIRQTVEEGGMCRVTMTFVESGEQSFPAATIDHGFSLFQKASSLIDFAKADFLFSVLVTRVPEYVRLAAKGEIDKLAVKLVNIVLPGASYTALSNYRRVAEALASISGSLSSDPNKASDAIVTGVQAVREAAPNAGVAIVGTQSLLAFTPDPEVGNSQMRNAARSNREAVADLVVRTSIAEQAKNIFDQTYLTYEDAVATRDTLVAQIDAAAETAPDDVYIALQELRADIVAAVPADEENLPRIGNVVLGESRPSLAVAYDLYEDVSRSEEIVARNRVRHPGFMPSGVKLKVLVDA